MTLVSQIGVVIIIAFIMAVLFKANHTLAEVAEEGEHFVDEWAMKEAIKEERREERREQRRKQLEQKRAAIESVSEPEDNWSEDNGSQDRMSMNHWTEDVETESETELYGYSNTQRSDYDGYRISQHAEQKEADVKTTRPESSKIIPMRFPENHDLVTLIQKNEAHQTVGRFKVDHYPFTIGRDATNDIVLDDLCVAKRHAQVELCQGRIVLRDKGTANKIFTEGGITDQMDLKDHHTFYIGHVPFDVEVAQGRSCDTRQYIHGVQ